MNHLSGLQRFFLKIRILRRKRGDLLYVPAVKGLSNCLHWIVATSSVVQSDVSYHKVSI